MSAYPRACACECTQTHMHADTQHSLITSLLCTHAWNTYTHTHAHTHTHIHTQTHTRTHAHTHEHTHEHTHMHHRFPTSFHQSVPPLVTTHPSVTSGGFAWPSSASPEYLMPSSTTISFLTHLSIRSSGSGVSISWHGFYMYGSTHPCSVSLISHLLKTFVSGAKWWSRPRLEWALLGRAGFCKLLTGWN